MEVAGAEAKAEVLEGLAGEACLHLVHTRDGAWLANMILLHGSPKDCKRMLKGFKGAGLDSFQAGIYSCLSKRA